MVNRNRGILLKFYVSEKELEQIRMKMEQYSTNNLSAYLRKIAIDGYVVNLELPELGELAAELMLRLLQGERCQSEVVPWSLEEKESG